MWDRALLPSDIFSLATTSLSVIILDAIFLMVCRVIDAHKSELWTKTVRRIQADQTFATKRLYPYCATLYGWDAPVVYEGDCR